MLNQTLLPELKVEAANTRKMLDRVPFDDAGWKPHAKSFAIGPLASHVADLVNWIGFTLDRDEIDWATFHYKTEQATTSQELLALFDKNLENAVKSLEAATDEQLMAPWTMRAGDQVFFTMPRIAVIRTFSLNHMIHHRAQLSVYLRLLDVPVPGMYGPTADEMA